MARHRAAPSWTGRDDPEDGPAALRFHHAIKADAPRAVLGFACEAGVRRNLGRPGASQGPDAIRKALASLPVPSGTALSDLGDVVVEGDDLEAGQELLAGHIAQGLSAHERLLVLGGGHETAYGSYLGLRATFPDARIGIINLDAHLDIRAISERGASSGTPFAQIRALDPDNFDYLCIGSAEEANTSALLEKARQWGVRIVSDHALIADCHAADHEIAAMTSRTDILYLTIDIDLLPHHQAPGVSAPAARGVPLSVVEHVIGRVLDAAASQSVALPLTDIVELSPPHDQQGLTARTAAYLARRLLLAP